jgi:hypothetical protein
MTQKIVVTNPVVELDGDDDKNHLEDRGLLHCAKLDENTLHDWCQDLEVACAEVINNDGIMMKDLATAIHGKDIKREHWVIRMCTWTRSMYIFFLLHHVMTSDVSHTIQSSICKLDSRRNWLLKRQYRLLPHW